MSKWVVGWERSLVDGEGIWLDEWVYLHARPSGEMLLRKIVYFLCKLGSRHHDTLVTCCYYILGLVSQPDMSGRLSPSSPVVLVPLTPTHSDPRHPDFTLDHHTHSLVILLIEFFAQELNRFRRGV